MDAGVRGSVPSGKSVPANGDWKPLSAIDLACIAEGFSRMYERSPDLLLTRSEISNVDASVSASHRDSIVRSSVERIFCASTDYDSAPVANESSVEETDHYGKKTADILENGNVTALPSSPPSAPRATDQLSGVVDVDGDVDLNTNTDTSTGLFSAPAAGQTSDRDKAKKETDTVQGLQGWLDDIL